MTSMTARTWGWSFKIAGAVAVAMVVIIAALMLLAR
jgi:hypothetical protein